VVENGDTTVKSTISVSAEAEQIMTFTIAP